MATKTVSMSFAPDLAAQQLQIERQRKLADMLQQQSMEEGKGQTVPGGFYVAPSPIQGIARMAQALMANKMQSSADTKQAELGQEQAKRLAAALKGLAPAGTFDDVAPQAAPGQLGSGTFGEVAPSNGAPTIPASPRVDDATRQAWARALAAMQINPELGSKLVENAATLTTNQKDMAAMGQDPRLMGALGVAKARSDGTMKMDPNATYLDLTTNQRQVAPDFKSGISGGYGPDGSPQMGRIAGSEALSQIAGETKRAESGAQADFDMVTVNTPTGPMMMTRAQAVKQASGQPTPIPATPSPTPANAGAMNSGFPAGAQLPSPSPSPAGSDRLSIMQAELAAIQARPDTDPRKAGDLAAINREIAALSQKPQAGIRLQSDAEKEAEVGRVKAKNAALESSMKNLPEFEKQRESAIVSGRQALDVINKALSHKGLGTATGLSGTLDPRNYIPGTDAKDFQTVLDQIKGSTFLQAFERLKGAGQITEVEGEKATNAIARLSRAQSDGEFMNSLNDLRDIVSDGLTRAKNRPDPVDVTEAKTVGPASNSMPSASGPAKVRKFNPLTGKIE
jgi:hypothetical protein